MVEPDGPQITIRRMRSACWITTATNIHSECVILIAFVRQQWSCLSYLYNAIRGEKMLVLYSGKVITRKNGSADSTVNLEKWAHV